MTTETQAAGNNHPAHLKDVDKLWSTIRSRSLRIAVHKENKQAGREVCNVTILGGPTYFWDDNGILVLGTAPHCGWWLLVLNNGAWINK